MALKISTLIISFLIAAFMLVGMVNMYSELFTTYNVPGTKNISITDDASILSDDLIGMGDRFKDAQGITDNIGIVIEGGWAAITTVLTFPDVMLNAFAAIATDNPNYEIPGWISSLVTIAVWAVFIFVILKIIFKVEV